MRAENTFGPRTGFSRGPAVPAGSNELPAGPAEYSAKYYAVRRGRRISAKLVKTNIPMLSGSGTESWVVTLTDQLSYPETAVNEVALLLSMAANPKVIGAPVAEKSG